MAMAWPNSSVKLTGSRLDSSREERHNLHIKISYIALQQLDLILTVFAISIGLSELNPLMRNMIDAPLELFLTKVAIPCLIAWLVPAKLLIPAIALLLFVIGWNVKELFLYLM